jgi:hypothetical protein
VVRTKIHSVIVIARMMVRALELRKTFASPCFAAGVQSSGLPGFRNV